MNNMFNKNNISLRPFNKYDYLIGEESYLKKGVGSVIVQELCRLISKLEKPVQFVADPVPQNTDSIKLLERNEFTLDSTTGLYVLYSNAMDQF